jgi:acyl-coenzyme A thioesterase 13
MSHTFSQQSSNENHRLAFLQNLVGQQLNERFSPVARWLDGRLLAISETALTMEFIVREDMCNPMQILHGGIAATILDDVVGTLVFALGREFAYSSINLNCDFLHAAKVGEVLTVSGKIIRAGKNIVHTEGVITGPNDKIIAKCASNLIQTSFKIPV